MTPFYSTFILYSVSLSHVGQSVQPHNLCTCCSFVWRYSTQRCPYDFLLFGKKKQSSKHCSPFKCISLARTLLTTLINEFQSPATLSFYYSTSIYFLLSIYHLPCPFNLLSCSGCLFLHILPLHIQCLEHCLAHGMCSINGAHEIDHISPFCKRT